MLGVSRKAFVLGARDMQPVGWRLLSFFHSCLRTLAVLFFL